MFQNALPHGVLRRIPFAVIKEDTIIDQLFLALQYKLAEILLYV
jgi:hypothetical protein